MKLFAVLGSLLVGACTSDELISESSSPLTADNGQNLNGQNLNGQNLNGQNLNGQNLNGPDNGTFTIWTSLVGIKLNGNVMDSAALAGAELRLSKGSTLYAGSDVRGAELVSMRGDGRTVRFRVRDVIAPAAGSTAWRYFVEYREDDLNWYPVCEDASGPRPAIALSGVWDHRQGIAGGGAHLADSTKITFSCENMGALGKCVAMGYEPWRAESGVNLWNHHQACVRLLRGDYCGDGSSYTANGNRVNLFDGLGIQEDTEDWVIEAEWDEKGARCFYPLNRSRAGIPCYDARITLACGSPTNFSSGALLMNETPTAGLTP